MFDKFSRSWELVKASAAVLRSDKELMVFPVVSAVATLVVLATFLVPMIGWRVFSQGAASSVIWVFLFYFCQYTVIVFCNSALVAAAMIRLDGGDPTLADGFNAAKARLPSILGYAAIAATVGVLLKRMKDDDNLLMRIVGGGLGAAWTLATFLVVPVLVHQEVGPFEALKRSANLLKRTWGENAIGNVGIGMAFGLISFAIIVVGALLAFVAAQLSLALAVSIVVLFVIGLLLLGVYQAALSGIYAAALYRYAMEGEAPPAFRALQLETAFAAK
ncbi:DUF6159 family protein [Lysobacter soli]|uniref:Glycerophosphoryl diester phosphodiesterase membrane domain-containing protein n=1 Tax=Lysobacter soli TaxID=453783 RepID=A0A3D8VFQ5_9GAMM|nr:DUF6159 family protein [Lysobacter soli]RDY67911.1 hypothetical protein DX912_08405 [Lysobacter soli]